ncbi:ABC-three component system middle component 6 [Pseudomonas sp. EggHat1]|uniref:ABC-three component system middle component 6 n=1 Tax=Pseudomonas sp. EggHat1 TaxID=2761624 RepID=UPI00299F6D52|nr:ABC-three component system middle component 6 [Pseudomonas sp. EggHat1]
MILSNAQSPAKSLYIIGGQILSTLKNNNFSEMSPLLLHREFNLAYDEVSFAYFMYALDWLFIAGCIELTKSGDISLCN